MFSGRRLMQTFPSFNQTIRAGSYVLLALCVTACSKQQGSVSEDDWSLDSGERIQADVDAGGMAASYTAYFDGAHVKRISETRKPEPGKSAKGDYEFTGARLVHYQGAALLGDQDLELKFTMQGAVTHSGGASDAEIAAIRNRASLLRSLALTKHSTQSHGS